MSTSTMSYGDNAPKLESVRTRLENILTDLAHSAKDIASLDLSNRNGETYPNWHDTEAHKNLLVDTIQVRRSIVGMLQVLDSYEATGHFPSKER